MKVFIGRFPKDHKKDRTVRVRIDKYDTWSMDHTLALIIHPMLVQLRAAQHGAPNTDDEPGMPEHLLHAASTPKENDWDIDSNHFDRWNWILDEMIWAFSQMIDDNGDNQFYSGEHDLLWQGLDKDDNEIGPVHELHDKLPADIRKKIVFYRMIEGPKHTFKIDHDSLTKYHERIKNGTHLFGKYYQNLWD